TSLTSWSRSGSIICISPLLIVSTTSGLMSQPRTVSPLPAMAAAVGRPMYPIPITDTLLYLVFVISLLLTVPCLNNLNYSLGSLAVTKWIFCCGHRFIEFPILYKGSATVNYQVAVSTHQSNRSCLKSFGPLGCIPHHQHRLSETGSLFLNTSAVRYHKGTPAHKVNKGQIFKRLNQVHIRDIAKQLPDGLLNIGIEVNRIDYIP